MRESPNRLLTARVVGQHIYRLSADDVAYTIFFLRDGISSIHAIFIIFFSLSLYLGRVEFARYFPQGRSLGVFIPKMYITQ